VRILAISTRWSPRPVTRPAHFAFDGALPFELGADVPHWVARMKRAMTGKNGGWRGQREQSDFAHPSELR
jgi:hypothetical protein